MKKDNKHRSKIGLHLFIFIAACFVSSLAVGNPAGSDAQNIASEFNITSSNHLGAWSADSLNDGVTKYNWGGFRWGQGTRMDPQSENPAVVFEFNLTNQSEPALVNGIRLYQDPWKKLNYTVEVAGPDGWKEAGSNANIGREQTLWLTPVRTYAIRLKVWGREVDMNAPDANDRYAAHKSLLGVTEVEIFGQLNVSELFSGLDITFGSDYERSVDEGAMLSLPTTVIGLPDGLSVSAEYIVKPLYEDREVERVKTAIGNGVNRADLGKLSPGAYRVFYAITSGESPLANGQVLVGVRSNDYLAGRVGAFSENTNKYPENRDSDPLLRHFLRSADINGLDSSHQVPEVDFYLDECARAGILPEIFFPWSAIEPLPGVYDFTFSDQLFGAVAQRGLYARITGNPFFRGNLPDWMVPYMALEFDSKKNTVNTNSAPSLFSPVIQEHGRRLTMLLMRRYGNHPGAFMWTLNVYGEFLWGVHQGKYMDVSPAALEAYKKHLAIKYSKIEDLNTAWGTEYRFFGHVTQPTPGLNHAWFDFCQFMLEATMDYYTPIAEMARSELPADTVLGVTGYVTGVEMFDFARKYDVWISSQGMENPQWVQWARILRSSGITPYGEPGYVHIRDVCLNRSVFLSLVGELQLYTYRQYLWPNDGPWQDYVHLKDISDRLTGASAIKLPIALAGTEESGLATGESSFAVAAIWSMVGGFYDTLLKMGMTTDAFDGYNTKALDTADAVIDLGSTVWSAASTEIISEYVNDGGKLVVLPLSQNRVAWNDKSKPVSEFMKEKDVLLGALSSSARLRPLTHGPVTLIAADNTHGEWISALSGQEVRQLARIAEIAPEATVIAQTTEGNPLIVSESYGAGEVIVSTVRPQMEITYGNSQSGPGGTGWNISFEGEQIKLFLQGIMKHLGISAPYQFKSDLTDTWACAFERDGLRFILVYNNSETKDATFTASALHSDYFPAGKYSIVTYNQSGDVKKLGDQPRESLAVTDAVTPYGLLLIELTPVK